MIKPANKSLNTQYNHNGFTLAETLITLVIVGIVAALTVPALIHKYQVQQYKSGYKAAYSLLGQAISSMYKDHGALSQSSFTGTEFKNILLTYLSCGDISDKYYSSSTDSVTKVRYDGVWIKKQYVNHDQSGTPYVWFLHPYCTLTNGMTIYGANWTPGGTSFVLGVDINGYNKGPNRWGYDLFHFGIYPNKSSTTLQPLNYAGCSKIPGKVENRYNGSSCAYYAALDKDPDNPERGYWDSL